MAYLIAYGLLVGLFFLLPKDNLTPVFQSKLIMKNFLYGICGFTGEFTITDRQTKCIDHIKETVRQNKKSYLKEKKLSIEEWKKAPDTVTFLNQVKPDGYSLDEEQWEIDKDHINQEIKEAEEYIKKLEESI